MRIRGETLVIGCIDVLALCYAIGRAFHGVSGGRVCFENIRLYLPFADSGAFQINNVQAKEIPYNPHELPIMVDVDVPGQDKTDALPR